MDTVLLSLFSIEAWKTNFKQMAKFLLDTPEEPSFLWQKFLGNMVHLEEFILQGHLRRSGEFFSGG